MSNVYVTREMRGINQIHFCGRNSLCVTRENITETAGCINWTAHHKQSGGDDVDQTQRKMEAFASFGMDLWGNRIGGAL